MPRTTELRLDLGLAALDCAEWRRAQGIPAGPLSQDRLAAACGVSRKAVRLVEVRATQKLAARIAADPGLTEAIADLVSAHGPAAFHSLLAEALAATRSRS